MTKSVQETVYEIIKFSKESGLRHIDKNQITEELKKTSLGENDIPNYSGKKSKLQTQLDQALYQLNKSGKIKMRGKGKYTIDSKERFYKPIICKHLQEKNGRPWCPVKQHYIGDPRMQCEVLHGTTTKGGIYVKDITPMCPGYTERRSTKVSREWSKKAIERANKIRDDTYTQAIKAKGRV